MSRLPAYQNHSSCVGRFHNMLCCKQMYDASIMLATAFFKSWQHSRSLLSSSMRTRHPLACCICRQTLTVGGSSAASSSCPGGLVCMLANCWLISAAVCASRRPVSQKTIARSSAVSQWHGACCAAFVLLGTPTCVTHDLQSQHGMTA